LQSDLGSWKTTGTAKLLDSKDKYAHGQKFHMEVSLNEFEPAKICYLLETLEQLVEDLKL
jgi:hypothetical protein